MNEPCKTCKFWDSQSTYTNHGVTTASCKRRSPDRYSANDPAAVWPSTRCGGAQMTEPDDKTDDEQLEIANELLELLRQRGVGAPIAVRIVGSVILECITHISEDQQDAIAGVQAIANDMVADMKERARASTN